MDTLITKSMKNNRELFTAQNTIETLKSDIKNMDKIESRNEYDINELTNQRNRYYDLVTTLKEKLFKSGTILKQVMSECDDLKREKKILENNYDFSKNITEQLKLESSNQDFDNRQKIQRYQDENSRLREQFK